MLRLRKILDSISRTQCLTSAKKWHKVLGELWFMALALPGARKIFSRLQNALDKDSKTQVTLDKGVHQTLDNFCWMADYIAARLTHIIELVPLPPSTEGHHNATRSPGAEAGGV